MTVNVEISLLHDSDNSEPLNGICFQLSDKDKDEVIITLKDPERRMYVQRADLIVMLALLKV